MSKRNSTRKQNAAVDRDYMTEIGRARARLLVGPSIEALREFQRRAIPQMERTLALLEDVRRWSDEGAEMSPRLASVARGLPGVGSGKGDTKPLFAEISGVIAGFESVAWDVLTQAFDGDAASVASAAKSIAKDVAKMVNDGAFSCDIADALTEALETNGLSIEDVKDAAA